MTDNTPEGFKGDIPEGFEEVSTTIPEAWKPEEPGDELIGTWLKEETLELRQGRGTREQRVGTVLTPEGERRSVYCSAFLTPLFDEVRVDDEIWIRYDGLGEASGGKQAPKLFTTARKRNS